jgi:hypothetical protein
VRITASSFGGGGINKGETKCIASQVNITRGEDVEKAITGAVKEFVRISDAASVPLPRISEKTA